MKSKYNYLQKETTKYLSIILFKILFKKGKKNKTIKLSEYRSVGMSSWLLTPLKNSWMLLKPVLLSFEWRFSYPYVNVDLIPRLPLLAARAHFCADRWAVHFDLYCIDRSSSAIFDFLYFLWVTAGAFVLLICTEIIFFFFFVAPFFVVSIRGFNTNFAVIYLFVCSFSRIKFYFVQFLIFVFSQ